MVKHVVAAAAALSGAVSLAGMVPSQGAAPQTQARRHRVVAAVRHDMSAPLRSIPVVAPAIALRPGEHEPGPFHQGRGPSGMAVDTVVQNFLLPPSIASVARSFDGVGNVNGVLPPDTNGDVGPNHFVQWVNLSFAVYSKGTASTPPSLLYGPAAGSTLWSGFGGPCESTNNGDPIVLYDHLADRWVMSQLAIPNSFFGLLMSPFYQCIAVSATPDPLGAYYRYQFSFDKLNDYPKLAVWPDGYYMTMNQYTSLSLQFAGQGVVAFDRASMLAGGPARMIYFDLAGVDMNLGGMLPADLDGPAPPPGSPAMYAQVDDDAWGYAPDQVQLWKFHADWSDPTQATFTRAAVLPTAPFDSDLCGYSRNCIPQPGGSAVDAIADRLMYRLQYRNFGDHDSLVLNHTVDADGTDHAGIRWYEIRDPLGDPFIYQQGTYAPDPDNRWMASAAMDGAGDIGLGFSVSSATTSPSIRYTGRLAADPPGLMTQGETTIVAGSGAQTDSSGRWGDYSMLAVDPVDDCTFWYTQEYYADVSAEGWRTRIGTFSFPGCAPASGPAVTISATTPHASEAGLVPGLFTLTRSGDTSSPLTVQYAVSGSATPDTDYAALSGFVVIPAGASTTTITVTPIDDALYEPDETVLLTLEPGPSYHVGLPGSAVVAIVSDDRPPDLVVSPVTAPATGGAGLTIAINDTTKNQGTGNAPASTTAFHLSTNTTLDGADVPLGSRSVASLAPGSTSTASTIVTLPPGTTTGTYYVIASADAGAAVTESVETNNTAVTAAIRIGPDLVVSSVSAPAIAAAGGAVVVNETTANQGAGAADPSQTTFYLSTNGLLDAADVELGSRAVPLLAPAESSASSTSLVIPATVSPGLYYVIAKADSGASVAETQESNNTRMSGAVKIGPDLTEGSVSVPSSAGPGQTITVTETTTNQGAGAAAPSTTTFYLSANVFLDGSDPAIGSRSVPAMAGGTASTASTPVVIPADTATGTYYVLAKADADGTVPESVETNNASFGVAIRIGPDLTESSLTVPSAGGAGATVTVSDTTKNAGGGTAPASVTSFYLSANLALDGSDVPLGSRAVPPLASGASSSASTPLTIPAETSTGTYYVLAKADGPGAIPESNEGNNVSFGAVLRVGPDLSVSSLRVPSTGGAGTMIVATDTTKNGGGGAAPASTTTFYLSANLSLDGSDVPLGSRGVPALAAGTSSSGSTSLEIPEDVPTGTYYVLAKADGPDSLTETTETNNVSFGAVVRIGPDLTVSALTVPSSVVAGATASVTDTTKNQGGGAAPASITRYYLSANLALDADDVLIGSRSVPPLAAGQSSAGSGTIVVPAGTPAGGYYVLAVSNADGAVAETLGNDNVHASLTRVTTGSN